MAALDRSGRGRPWCRRRSSHPRRSGQASDRGCRAAARGRRASGSRRRVNGLRQRPPTCVGSPGSDWTRSSMATGALNGQRLVLGLDGERVARSMVLAPEAFASGPFGGIVLVGSDDGATSHVQAIDVARGCAWPLAAERDVVRRATIDPAGTFIYEMRVDRASRADLGIWRRPIDGTSAARQVLGPPPPDVRFGRTFSTEFTWDVAGDRLAVQSCAEVACRIRVITPGGGPTVTLDSPELGQIVGLDGDLAVTYEACRGLPCPIVSTDLRDGRAPSPRAGRRTWPSSIPTSDGARLIHEVSAGSARRSAVRRARRRGRAGSGADPRRPSAPSLRRPRRRSDEPACRLGAPRSRGPPSGRRQHGPPAAPPRPGWLDRPAR